MFCNVKYKWRYYIRLHNTPVLAKGAWRFLSPQDKLKLITEQNILHITLGKVPVLNMQGVP